jgi:hypothetical protein
VTKIDTDVVSQFTDALEAVIANLLETSLEQAVEKGLEGYDFSADIEKEVEKAVEDKVGELPDFDNFLQLDNVGDFLRENDIVTSDEIEEFVKQDDVDTSIGEVEEKLAEKHQAMHERVMLTLAPFDALRQPGLKGVLARLRFIALGR